MSKPNKVKDVGGRPSKYTDEMATEICRDLAGGESLRAICRRSDMPAYSTVALWLVNGKHPKFSDQYTIARKAQGHFHVDTIIDVAMDTLNKEVDPQRAKVVIDALKWTAARMDRSAWGDKELPSRDGNAIQPVEVTVSVVDASKSGVSIAETEPE